MPSNRNETLELLKLFASYMVVFIHVPFYGKLGVAMDALARFAVPLFFLISGFYAYNTSFEKLRKRTIHIIYLFIFSVALYTAWNIIPFLYNGDFTGLLNYFNRYLKFQTLFDLFIFNCTVCIAHLWYLLAIIYVYIIFGFAFKYKVSEKVIFVASFILLGLHLLAGEFFSILGGTIPAMLVRNFALLGIPFFGIGMFTKKYEQHFMKVPSFAISISIAIGIIATLLSRRLFGKNELYAGSLFILFAVVVIFIEYKQKKYSHTLNSLTGCSTYIYIIHPLLSSLIYRIYEACGISIQSSITMQMFHPLLVCLLSTIVAYYTQRILK